MTNNKVLLFAYGSNMNLRDLNLYFKKNNVKANISIVGVACLKNYKLSWSKFSKTRDCGTLNIESSENSEVWGIVIQVDKYTLQLFDKKEGHPKHYQRIKVSVVTNENSILETHTYTSHPAHITANFWPTEDYLNTVISGAIEHKLPTDYIKTLQENVPVFKTISNQSKHKVAIYSGLGVGPQTLYTWQQLFKNYDIASLDILYSHQFTKENIEKYHLIILPGGGGLRICWGLGDIGKENIRNYLRNGGKLLGVCAGAYAISAQRKDYLGVSPVKIVDFKNCCRGEALLDIRITIEGSSYFKTEPNSILSIIYHNGPVVYHVDILETKNLEVLATFKQELTHVNGTAGDMINTPAIWMNDYAKGKVIGISPHIERTINNDHYIAAIINKLLTA
ncbi:MAG: BPL-N domain-containing protein [Bacteroidales bacterium]|nr:BPL-N domain-containing protein [Bacteroidales bacterium]